MNKSKTNLVVAAAFAVLAIVGTVMNSQTATAQQRGVPAPVHVTGNTAATQTGPAKAVEPAAEEAAACNDGYTSAAQGGCARDRKSVACLVDGTPCGGPKSFCTTVPAKNGPLPFSCKCI